MRSFSTTVKFSAKSVRLAKTATTISAICACANIMRSLLPGASVLIQITSHPCCCKASTATKGKFSSAKIQNI